MPEQFPGALLAWPTAALLIAMLATGLLAHGKEFPSAPTIAVLALALAQISIAMVACAFTRRIMPVILYLGWATTILFVFLPMIDVGWTIIIRYRFDVLFRWSFLGEAIFSLAIFIALKRLGVRLVTADRQDVAKFVFPRRALAAIGVVALSGVAVATNFLLAGVGSVSIPWHHAIFPVTAISNTIAGIGAVCIALCPRPRLWPILVLVGTCFILATAIPPPRLDPRPDYELGYLCAAHCTVLYLSLRLFATKTKTTIS